MDIEKAIKESEVIFIAVGTPPNHDGSADLSQIENVARQIGACLNGYKVIVNKSTVPVGTASRIKKIIAENQEMSLRATEGSEAIPSSVIPSKAGIHPLVITGNDTPSVIARSEATRQSQKEPIPFDVVSNPEFLREGSAVQDLSLIHI